MTEDPTERIHTRPSGPAGYAPDAPTTAMPGPLNLAGSADADAPDSATTDVLSLDELFDGHPSAERTTTAPASSTPTWTAPARQAMPVVPVRSEPMTAAPAAAPRTPESSPPPVAGRMRTDAAAAWDGTLRRTRGWLARNDNALMLLTALVAVLLILAVMAFSG